MALVVKDRVQETTTTTGTGTYTLAGAMQGFQSFSVVGNGNTTYYGVTNGTDWEVGLGTYTASGTTLSRDTILESSNSGNAVNWGAGTKNIFVTYPAERAVLTDSSGVIPNSVTTATSSNTASAIVARDASGDFSAGTITATLSGSATSAGSVTNAVTFNNGGAGAASGTTFNGSVARTISYNTVGAPSTTGTGASGTWAISVSGNAANVTGVVAIANGGTGGSSAITGLRNQYVGSWQRETNGGTLAPGGTYSVWTGGGAITMNLPTRANCQNGDKIYIQNLLLTWGTTNFTIARSDSNTLIMNLAENLVCNTNVGSIVLTCVWNDGSNAYWNVAPGG